MSKSPSEPVTSSSTISFGTTTPETNPPQFGTLPPPSTSSFTFGSTSPTTTSSTTTKETSLSFSSPTPSTTPSSPPTTSSSTKETPLSFGETPLSFSSPTPSTTPSHPPTTSSSTKETPLSFSSPTPSTTPISFTSTTPSTTAPTAYTLLPPTTSTFSNPPQTSTVPKESAVSSFGGSTPTGSTLVTPTNPGSFGISPPSSSPPPTTSTTTTTTESLPTVFKGVPLSPLQLEIIDRVQKRDPDDWINVEQNKWSQKGLNAFREFVKQHYPELAARTYSLATIARVPTKDEVREIQEIERTIQVYLLLPNEYPVPEIYPGETKYRDTGLVEQRTPGIPVYVITYPLSKVTSTYASTPSAPVTTAVSPIPVVVNAPASGQKVPITTTKTPPPLTPDQQAFIARTQKASSFNADGSDWVNVQDREWSPTGRDAFYEFVKVHYPDLWKTSYDARTNLVHILPPKIHAIQILERDIESRGIPSEYYNIGVLYPNESIDVEAMKKLRIPAYPTPVATYPYKPGTVIPIKSATTSSTSPATTTVRAPAPTSFGTTPIITPPSIVPPPISARPSTVGKSTSPRSSRGLSPTTTTTTPVSPSFPPPIEVITPSFGMGVITSPVTGKESPASYELESSKELLFQSKKLQETLASIRGRVESTQIISYNPNPRNSFIPSYNIARYFSQTSS